MRSCREQAEDTRPPLVAQTAVSWLSNEETNLEDHLQSAVSFVCAIHSGSLFVLGKHIWDEDIKVVVREWLKCERDTLARQVDLPSRLL